MVTHQAQRSSNTLRVVNVLRKNSLSTVGDISERAHLSRLTVARILVRLGKADIVREAGKAAGSAEGGRKPLLYHFNATARLGLGILIGTGSVSGRLVDLNFRTVEQHANEISPLASAEELVRVIDRLVSDLVTKANIAREDLLGIGIGTHGVTDSEHGIVLTSPHNPGWGPGLRLREVLQARLGPTPPIFIDNSIRFRTLAETTAGRLRGVADAIVIHCADGLIAGNVLNGSIHRGVHNFAGSIGHMKVNIDDRERCDCGGVGCLEMQVMPRRVFARVRELSSEYPNSEALAEAEDGLSIARLGKAADAGDELARVVLNETVYWFSIAIHNLILMFDPEKVVIQGTYARAGDYFLASLREKIWGVSLVNVPYRTSIECSVLEDDEAGTLGAASHVIASAFA